MMTSMRRRGAPNGFSLVEILVALVIVGILTTLLGQVMQSVMQGSAELRQRFQNADESVMIRRLLHRDLQSLSSVESLLAEDKVLFFSTTHSQMQDEPLPVYVQWQLQGTRLVRTERAPQLDYIGRMEVLDGVSDWSFEYYSLLEGRWLDAPGVALVKDLQVTALRVVFSFEDGTSLDMVERLPHAMMKYGGSP